MRTFRYDVWARHDPARELHWRWRRAKEVLDTGQNYSTRRDDLETGRAVGFLRALRRSVTPAQLARLRRKMPDLMGAYQLHNDDGRVRLEVEARFLAKQSPAEIAAKVGVSSDAVRTYEALFFNVADRIKCCDYIVVRAIRQTYGGDKRWGQLSEFVRATAFFGGPAVLDVVWSHLDDLLHLKDAAVTAWPRKSETPVEELRRLVSLCFVAYREWVTMKAGNDETELHDDAIHAVSKRTRKRADLGDEKSVILEREEPVWVPNQRSEELLLNALSHLIE